MGGLSWQEVTVLSVVSLGATAVAVLGSFDPLPVYVGVLGWGGRSAVGR
jgi:hypothetical protein